MSDTLLGLAIEDSAEITALRDGDPVQLGLALAEAGCSVEAAPLLRPARKQWAADPRSEAARSALAAVTWWNKNWRAFAQAMQGNRFEEARELLGDQARNQWDRPPMLLHVSRVARHEGRPEIARHCLARLLYLCDRGLPKTDMTVFRYAAEASMVEILAEAGDVDAALAGYRNLTPNPGNLMGHQIQGAALLAQAGQAEAAMNAIAKLLATAQTRKGWGRENREAFVTRDPVLDPLRQRSDWHQLLSDPAAYLKSRS